MGNNRTIRKLFLNLSFKSKQIRKKMILTKKNVHQSEIFFSHAVFVNLEKVWKRCLIMMLWSQFNLLWHTQFLCEFEIFKKKLSKDHNLGRNQKLIDKLCFLSFKIFAQPKFISNLIKVILDQNLSIKFYKPNKLPVQCFLHFSHGSDDQWLYLPTGL